MEDITDEQAAAALEALDSGGDTPVEAPAPENNAPIPQGEETKEEPKEADPVESEEDDADFERKPKSKSNVKRLLAQRNEARRELEEERARREELEKKFTTEDEPQGIRSVVEEILSEKESESSEWQALETRFPESKDRRAEIKTEMGKHSSMSPLGAYALLKGKEALKGGSAQGSGRESVGEIGGRMNPSQFQEKDPTTSSTSEMESYLRAEEKEGRL